MLIVRTAATSLLWLILGLNLVGQTTLYVPSVSSPTIQSALNLSTGGELIVVSAGTYIENLNWPPVDVHLKGAGPGLSVIDGNQSGSCVAVAQGATAASVIEGFTLTNGSGTPTWVNTSLSTTGGGLHIVTGSVPTDMTIRNCHISNNTAYEAGGVHLRYAAATFEDCLFSANNFTGAIGASTTSLLAEAGGLVVLRRCVFSSDVTLGRCVSLMNGNPITMESCRFVGITAATVVSGSGLSRVRVSSSIFEDNVVDKSVLWLTHAPLPSSLNDDLVFESNAFLGNDVTYSGTSSYGAVVGLASNSACDVTGLTMADNTLQSPQGGCIALGATFSLRDSVIHGNLGPGGLVRPAFHQIFPSPSFTVVNSIIEGWTGGDPSVLDMDPLFLARTSGDFRPAPGSPLIDAGSATPVYTPPAVDALRLPRTRGSSLDWGAFEAQSLAHHPAADGRVGESSGGPFDILLVNGSAGDTLRTIRVPVGTAATMEMLQPPQLSLASNFSIFGILGEADFDTVTSVPLGIGDMMFAPAPLVPFLQPIVFTMASTVGPINSVIPLFAATPTPWNSGVGPSIPFPLTMTLQGVIEEAPGVYVPTNALIYVVE